MRQPASERSENGGLFSLLPNGGLGADGGPTGQNLRFYEVFRMPKRRLTIAIKKPHADKSHVGLVREILRPGEEPQTTLTHTFTFFRLEASETWPFPHFPHPPPAPAGCWKANHHCCICLLSLLPWPEPSSCFVSGSLCLYLPSSSLCYEVQLYPKLRGSWRKSEVL